MVMFAQAQLSLIAALATSAAAQSSSGWSSQHGYVVNGATQGGVQPRRNVIDLQANHIEQFNMYVLALNALQQTDYNDPLSFFALANVHGGWFPGTAGMGDPCSGCAGNPAGYCPHQTTLFLPWHRPYLALYEQQLQAHAISIASAWDDPTYTAAAAQMRLPYWDWARSDPKQGNYPDFFYSQSLTMKLPNGTTTLPNPIYQYVMPGNYTFWAPDGMARGTQTVRYPLNGQDTSNNDLAQATLNAQCDSFASALYTAFSDTDNQFNDFGTELVMVSTASGGTQSLSTVNNIESIHNNVHTSTGGAQKPGQQNGTMAAIPASSFDPLFWMHHAMVDRVYNMYSAVYPGQVMQPSSSASGTRVIMSGATLDVDTPLAPFINGQGSAWTTGGTWNTTVFGYYYEDLAVSSPAELQTNLIKLYDPAARTSQISKRGTSEMPDEDYAAYIYLDTAHFTGVTKVYVFDGPVDESDPITWVDAPNLLAVTNFQCCGNGRHTNKHIAKQRVPLDVSRLAVPRLRAAHINPHLNARVECRIWAMTHDNEVKVFRPDEIDDFSIRIASRGRHDSSRHGQQTLIMQAGQTYENELLG